MTALAVMLLSTGSVLAQVAAPKVASKKVEASRLMTREELRACMKRQEDIKAKSAALDQAKAAMAQEKQGVASANDELKALRDEAGKQSDIFKQTDAAVREHSVRVEQWNIDMKEAEDSPMRSAERRKKELQNERAGLTTRNNELLAQRDAQFKRYEAAVEQFNARSKALEANIKDWNQRNQNLVDDADKVLEMHDNYSADCGGRRFREEDETAIKSGQ
jgi:chromosome segregation ATPase